MNIKLSPAKEAVLAKTVAVQPKCPQGLKPGFILRLCGTTEVVP